VSASGTVDAVVVGAGVVGLATARALARAGHETLVLEATDRFGSGTSSRNSEVIHAGIYYPTGSLKARLCVAGRERLYAYCAERGVDARAIGKVIVATTEAELATLERYRSQARANGAGDLAPLDRAELRALEPAVRGVGGLHSPRSGIVDSHALMVALLGDLEAAGGVLVTGAPVTAVRAADAGLELEVGGRDPTRLVTGLLVNAAGLGAPGLAARMALPGVDAPRQWYARGRYYGYTGAVPFRHLVYPVAGGGGLGVHLTLDLAGAARFGPDVAWIEDEDYAFDDSERGAFVEAIRRYWPELDPARLAPAYTGIRPKLVGPGAPAADFRIDGPGEHGVPGLVQLFGIESPGLTASLALADEVLARLTQPGETASCSASASS
jgi:L-2-hydroxyglutarate oxidase LhgO